jgi:hypothetical protein
MSTVPEWYLEMLREELLEDIGRVDLVSGPSSEQLVTEMMYGLGDG